MAVLLALLAPFIADLFKVTGPGRDLVVFFCRYASFIWVLNSFFFVAVAVFNNLGHAGYPPPSAGCAPPWAPCRWSGWAPAWADPRAWCWVSRPVSRCSAWWRWRCAGACCAGSSQPAAAAAGPAVRFHHRHAVRSRLSPILECHVLALHSFSNRCLSPDPAGRRADRRRRRRAGPARLGHRFARADAGAGRACADTQAQLRRHAAPAATPAATPAVTPTPESATPAGTGALPPRTPAPAAAPAPESAAPAGTGSLPPRTAAPAPAPAPTAVPPPPPRRRPPPIRSSSCRRRKTPRPAWTSCARRHGQRPDAR